MKQGVQIDTWLHLEFRSLNVLYWHLYYLCLSILGILFAQHLIFDGFFCLFLSVNILIFIQIWIYIFRSILYFDILLSFTHYVIPIFFHDVTGSFYRVHSLVTWYTYTSDALLGFLCIVTVQHCWLCYANDSLCYDVNKLSFVHFIKWTDITVTAVLNILVTLSPVMWCCIVVIVVLFHSFVLYLHPSLQCSIL